MTDDVSFHSQRALFRERLAILLFLLVVSGLTVGDILQDYLDGAEPAHLIVEALVVIGALVLAAVSLRRMRLNARTREGALRTRLAQVSAEAERWQAEASQHLAGLSAAIDTQFTRWELSPAEKEVALLLLKGLATQEIANVRETSERTVRQQAAAVYRKSGVDGRAQLAAFFLEDLLIPAREGQSRQ